MSRLEEARLEFEESLEDLRAASSERIGWAPLGGWLVPLIGLAMGTAAGFWLRRLWTGRPERRSLRSRS